MTGFEYSLGIVSIVVGLALTDVAQSTHRLLVRRRTVRWDPLTLLVAFYALLTVVRMWFAVWGVRDVSAVVNYLFYLSIFAELFVLFLLAAASLPDNCEGEDGDLRAYYERQRRYLWTLFTLFHASFLAHWVYFHTDLIGRRIPLWPSILWPLFSVAGSAVLIFTRRRPVHYAVVGAMIAISFWKLWGASF